MIFQTCAAKDARSKDDDDGRSKRKKRGREQGGARMWRAGKRVAEHTHTRMLTCGWELPKEKGSVRADAAERERGGWRGPISVRPGNGQPQPQPASAHVRSRRGPPRHAPPP